MKQQDIEQILSLLSHSPIGIDEIVGHTNLQVKYINQILTSLVLEGRIQKLDGFCFVLL